MKITRFNRAESYEPEPDWKRLSLCSESDISIEYFVKPAGHASPRHSHPAAQILHVLEGKLRIQTGRGESAELDRGDTAYLPGNEEHVVINPLSTPSSGLDIFVPGRAFDFWLKRGK